MSLFFILSKILNVFLQPVFHSLFLFAGGFGLWVFDRRRLSRLCFILGFMLPLAYSFTPLSGSLLRALENYADPPLPQQIAAASGIIVLGGFAGNPLVSEDRQAPQLSGAAERFYTALLLNRRYPEKPVWFSGFSGTLTDRGWTEDIVTKKLIAGLALENQNFFYEDKSRNTAQNARFTFQEIAPQAGETWVLVTSASHMLRAHKSFLKAGWRDLILYPVDYQTTSRQLDAAILSSGAVSRMSVVFHEYAGLAAYWLTGRL